MEVDDINQLDKVVFRTAREKASKRKKVSSDTFKPLTPSVK
jgi:hypothetical protein